MVIAIVMVMVSTIHCWDRQRGIDSHFWDSLPPNIMAGPLDHQFNGCIYGPLTLSSCITECPAMTMSRDTQTMGSCQAFRHFPGALLAGYLLLLCGYSHDRWQDVLNLYRNASTTEIVRFHILLVRLADLIFFHIVLPSLEMSTHNQPQRTPDHP